MTDIILASASPRRKQLFQMMGISCTVDPSDIEEVIEPNRDPEYNVCRLAEQKAEDVVRRYENAIIIAADTIVVNNGIILGKPESGTDAANMLRSLSGGHHYVYSGVAVIESAKIVKSDQRISFFQKTKVTFSTLDDTEINQYITTGNPMDKAGAYGIQDDYGSLFIKKIEGSYNNVVGFPVNKFYQTMKVDHPDMFKKVFHL